MVTVPLGMERFPSRLFTANAVLDLFIGADAGPSCILTTFQLRDEGAGVSGSRSGTRLGPEQHE